MANEQTIFRTCSLCEAHCGIAVEVDPERREILRIRGDRDNPMSRGYICPKAHALKQIYEDPDRLRRPLVRSGGELQEASWEAALDRAAEGLLAVRERFGANAVATYLGNPNIHDYASMLYNPTLQRALGTKWRFSATSVDQLPKVLSAGLMFGLPGSFPVPDIDRTDFLLMLGANPMASNGSLMTAPDLPGRLRALRERGGTLVVLDPRRSETAAIADEHHFVRPGSDALLLFAWVHTLFEEDRVDCGRLEDSVAGRAELRAAAAAFPPERVADAVGLSPETIRQLIRRFSEAERAVCYGRMGTTTQDFGSLASWLVDAINVLTGNLDEPGGAMFPHTAHASATSGRSGRPLPFGRWHTRVRGLPEFAGELPVAALAEEIDTDDPGRVRGLLTIAGNPVLSTPNADRLEGALRGLDFMVSIDIYLNETTRYADVVLPTSSPVERENYGLAFHAQSVRNFAKWDEASFPAEKDLPDPWRVSLELAARLLGKSASAVDASMREELAAARFGRGSDGRANVPEGVAGEGPAALLDVMLRSGSYGPDGAAGAGLRLEELRNAPHGLDLGPLDRQLPELLRTESGFVELAPEALLADCDRLDAWLAEERSDLVLIGRRHMRSNNSWLHNAPALAKGRDRCTLRMHPEDARPRGIADASRVEVRSRVGRVSVPVELSDEMMRGVVSLPHGHGHDGRETRLRVAVELQPGANLNALSDDQQVDRVSGNASLNGIPVEVSAATDSPL